MQINTLVTSSEVKRSWDLAISENSKLHFSIFLMQKFIWQQKAINANKYFHQDSFYLFCALEMQKRQF